MSAPFAHPNLPTSPSDPETLPHLDPETLFSPESPHESLPNLDPARLEMSRTDFEKLRQVQLDQPYGVDRRHLAWQRLLHRVQMSSLSQKRMVSRDHFYKPWILMQQETADIIKIIKTKLQEIWHEREACINRLEVQEKAAQELMCRISLREDRSQHGKFIKEMETKRFEHAQLYISALDKNIAFFIEYIDQLSIRSDLISCPQCFSANQPPEEGREGCVYVNVKLNDAQQQQQQQQ